MISERITEDIEFIFDRWKTYKMVKHNYNSGEDEDVISLVVLEKIKREIINLLKGGNE
jgi:hypothetical protein